MQPNTIGSEDRSVEYGWFTKASLVRKHTAEGHMQVAEMHKHKKGRHVVDLTLIVVAVVGGKIKIGDGRVMLIKHSSSIQ